MRRIELNFHSDRGGGGLTQIARGGGRKTGANCSARNWSKLFWGILKQIALRGGGGGETGANCSGRELEQIALGGGGGNWSKLLWEGTGANCSGGKTGANCSEGGLKQIALGGGGELD